jgi:hypothetical protein
MAMLAFFGWHGTIAVALSVVIGLALPMWRPSSSRCSGPQLSCC